MKHNRPFYGEKVSVIIVYNDDLNFCDVCLPRWIEQIYKNTQIIVVNNASKNNPYSYIQNILQRYGKQIDDHEIMLIDLVEKTDNQTAINIAIEKSEGTVVCVSSTNCFPSPYHIDILMIGIENDIIFYDEHSTLYSKNRIETTKNIPIHGPIYSLNTKFPKCSVFIPVMDREENIIATLPHWFQQRYPNYQIIIIDYSSQNNLMDTISNICKEHRKTFSCDPHSDTNVIFLRIEEMKYFNISHAYNYAISRIETDFVSTACADSVPWNYYLQTCMQLANEDNLIQIHWGLHTLSKKNWEKLNGHQEFIVGWGAEDDDFRIRATLMGLNTIHLPSQLVYQIPQDHIVKGTNRQIKDISESRLTNQSRFYMYVAEHGYVGNYGLAVGGDVHIEYKSAYPVKTPLRLWCWKKCKSSNLLDDIKYSEDFKLFYKVSCDDFECGDYCIGPYDHFYINSEADVDKYLCNA